MLSPRVLHFGKDQFFWQCLSLTACESAPQGLPSSVQATPKKELHWRRSLHEGRMAGDHHLTDKEKADLQLDDVWKMAVRSYSCTNLTFSKDRLMALSGIANVMGAALKERYIAGLWAAAGGDMRLSNLPEQLGWRVLDGKRADGTASRRFEKYCAPTWSWASVDGVIEMKTRVDQNRDYQASIQSVDIKLEYDHVETGRVRAGSSLIIKGILLAIRLDPSPHDPAHYVWQPDPTRRTSWCHAWLDQIAQFVPDTECLEATVLLLAYSTMLPPMRPAGTSGHGILIKSAPHSPGSFERIGMLEFRSLSSTDWLDLSRNQRTNLDGSRVDSVDQPFHQEVVTLI
jgi:hypothetical protein